MTSAPLLAEGDDWPSDTARRLTTLYPNQGARLAAWPMARSHRHAIQYLEQAPALVPFVSWGAPVKTGADRRVMAQRFIAQENERIEAGRRKQRFKVGSVKAWMNGRLVGGGDSDE